VCKAKTISPLPHSLPDLSYSSGFIVFSVLVLLVILAAAGFMGFTAWRGAAQAKADTTNV